MAETKANIVRHGFMYLAWVLVWHGLSVPTVTPKG